MITFCFSAPRRLARAILALALATILWPQEAAARTLNLEDLIENDERMRYLQDQKLDSFVDPELFALLQEANVALSNGDYATAQSRALALTERSPESPQGWLLLGLALANVGNVDGAIDALDKADAIYEVNAGPLVVKAELLLARGDTDAARETFLAAAAKDPADWRPHESLADMALAAGDVPGAISHLETQVALSGPGDLAPRLRLASLLLGEERVDDARAVLDAFAGANPDHAGVRIALGRIAFSEGRNDEAEQLFDAAIALEPAEPGLRVFKARAQINAGQFDAAEATLDAAMVDFPDSREVQFERASLFGLIRDYARAAEAFRVGLVAWPEDPVFRSGLSQAAYRLGDYETAHEQAAALAARPEATAADHFWHAVVLERMERAEEAVAAYEIAIEGDPDNWIALNNLASLLTNTAPDRAVTLAERALTASGDVAQVKSTLGWALFTTGEPSRALALLNEAAGGAPDNATIAYRLGRVLIETGETDAGREMLKNALTIDPEFRDAAQARQILSAN